MTRWFTFAYGGAEARLEAFRETVAAYRRGESS
jgi:hypothetical protein